MSYVMVHVMLHIIPHVLSRITCHVWYHVTSYCIYFPQCSVIIDNKIIKIKEAKEDL